MISDHGLAGRSTDLPHYYAELCLIQADAHGEDYLLVHEEIRRCKAYVITLEGHAYSEACAERCIRSAQGIEVQRFNAISAGDAIDVAESHDLRWTWRDAGNCPITGLRFHRYGGGLGRVGCALSHFLLWQMCAETEVTLILEHDAVFVRPFGLPEFESICQVNDPSGATPSGDWWSEQMAKRGPGVFPKTHVLQHPRPDGLAGNSAYLIKPHAAQHMVDLARRVGLWPNDALMCRQLVPGLQELYPFLTRVEQSQSTTCT